MLTAFFLLAEKYIVVAGPFFVIGAIVGLIQRPKRKRMFISERANQDFLRKHGITEIRDDAAPYQDARGNRLRLIDTHKDRLTFMVVGRRNVRAFIDLDKNGLMTRYTGPVKI